MMAITEISIITQLSVNKILFESDMTINSAMRLLRKCAKIGTKMLSVFRYRIATHIAKTNAENIEPKVCRDAKRSDEIKIAKVVGTISCNRFRKTPLKINSSEIGETIMVASKLPDKDKLKIPYDLTSFKIKLDR